MKRSRSGSSGEFARRTEEYSAERVSTTQRQGPMWPTLARFDWSRIMRRMCRGLMAATDFQANMAGGGDLKIEQPLPMVAARKSTISVTHQFGNRHDRKRTKGN